MDTKSAITYSAVPKSVSYKDALRSSGDFIRDSRKVTLIPSSSGAFGPGSQTECLIDIDDGGAGAFLHPDSCYITCDIKTVTAVGGDTGVASASFNSSANDVLDRVVVKGKRSRVMLADCRDYGVWSAMRDRLRYPQAYNGDAPWSRGFPKKVQSVYSESIAAGTNLATPHNVNFGIGSRAPALVAELGAGTRRFKLEMSYCPFFANDKIVPLSSSGGLQLQLTFARVNDAFVGHIATNGVLPGTTLDYRVTNLRFHCMISYMSERFMQAYNSQILAGGVAIPYDSYISLSHIPQSTNETVRLSSNLEHLKSVFVVHRLTADINKINKCSLGHFGNPLLEEIQLVSGGVTQPTTPLVVTTSSGTNITGQAVEELMMAASSMDHHLVGKDFPLDQDSMEITLTNSDAGKTTIAQELGPKITEVANWNGCSIISLKTDSSSPYASIFNRSNSTNQSPQRKSDINATLKYEGTFNQATATANFFLYHGNVLHVRPNGMMVPEQLSF